MKQLKHFVAALVEWQWKIFGKLAVVIDRFLRWLVYLNLKQWKYMSLLSAKIHAWFWKRGNGH